MDSRFEIGTYNEHYLYLGVVDVVFLFGVLHEEGELYHLIFSNTEHDFFGRIDQLRDKKDIEQTNKGLKEASQILPKHQVDQYKYVAWLTDEELEKIWPDDPQSQLTIGEIVPFLPYTESKK